MHLPLGLLFARHPILPNHEPLLYIATEHGQERYESASWSVIVSVYIVSGYTTRLGIPTSVNLG
jgi:hypothetical protein